MTPRFITFEGGEGAGKSTQVALLLAKLKEKGIEVIATREPGGTPGAEAIRELVVNGDKGRWLPISEILLFAAARVDHVERVIKPALAAGKWVLCDRFSDSTLAYQGYGLEQDKALIDRIRQLTLKDFTPDLTIILDLDPETGLARAGKQQRYEMMGVAFHQKLRAGFHEIAKADPDRCVIIDASQILADVSAAIDREVTRRFAL